jgi:hypothetical protein
LNTMAHPCNQPRTQPSCALSPLSSNHKDGGIHMTCKYFTIDVKKGKKWLGTLGVKQSEKERESTASAHWEVPDAVIVSALVSYMTKSW